MMCACAVAKTVRVTTPCGPAANPKDSTGCHKEGNANALVPKTMSLLQVQFECIFGFTNCAHSACVINYF